MCHKQGYIWDVHGNQAEMRKVHRWEKYFDILVYPVLAFWPYFELEVLPKKAAKW